MKTVLWGSIWTAVYAAIHSLLAGETIKDAFKRRFGERAFNGVYRLFFNVFALLSFAVLVRGFRGLSGRTLYDVQRPWSILLRGLQIAGALMALDANVRIGIGRMWACRGCGRWCAGRSRSSRIRRRGRSSPMIYPSAPAARSA